MGQNVFRFECHEFWEVVGARDIGVGAICRGVTETMGRWCGGRQQGLNVNSGVCVGMQCVGGGQKEGDAQGDSFVRSLRCCKSEQCEDGEYTFEFGQETDTDFMLRPVVLQME